VLVQGAHAEDAFRELKALGVELHIDDFGTGYSSLSYLDRFPVDTVKVDRSLVGRIGPEGEGGQIVEAVVRLAHGLGMRVTAEGVETPAQLARLRQMGCDFVQGFLFAPPLPAEEIEALLRDGRRS
jgi:EAL domain-containing protein (putative c-di-GMP-specific phosphodiesterase class I)